MDFALKIMDCALKMMDFVQKMMDFTLKMMDFTVNLTVATPVSEGKVTFTDVIAGSSSAVYRIGCIVPPLPEPAEGGPSLVYDLGVPSKFSTGQGIAPPGRSLYPAVGGKDTWEIQHGAPYLPPALDIQRDDLRSQIRPDTTGTSVCWSINRRHVLLLRSQSLLLCRPVARAACAPPDDAYKWFAHDSTCAVASKLIRNRRRRAGTTMSGRRVLIAQILLQARASNAASFVLFFSCFSAG